MLSNEGVYTMSQKDIKLSSISWPDIDLFFNFFTGRLSSKFAINTRRRYHCTSNVPP